MHMEKDKTCTSNHRQNNSKWTVAVSKESKIKLSEDHIGAHCHHLGIEGDFLNNI